MTASLLGELRGLDLVFAVCALAGGLFFLARFVMLLLGGVGGHDVDSSSFPADGGAADAGVDQADPGAPHHDTSGEAAAAFKMFSVQGITAFFMMFGLVGLGLTRYAAGPLLSLAGALAAGGLTLWVVKWAFTLMLRLQSSGTFGPEAALGGEATVYLNIPPGGTGKVQVQVRQHLREYEAAADDPQAQFKTGDRVRVLRVHDGRLLIVGRAGS